MQELPKKEAKDKRTVLAHMVFPFAIRLAFVFKRSIFL